MIVVGVIIFIQNIPSFLEVLRITYISLIYFIIR